MIRFGNHQNMDVVNKETTSPLSDDVAAVFKIIKEFRATQPQPEDYPQQNLAKKLSTPVTILVLVILSAMMALLYFLPPTTWGSTEEKVRFIVQLFVITSYILGVAVFLLHVLSIKPFFKDPTANFLESIGDLASYEITMFEKLDELSLESVQYAVNRLKSSSAQFDRLRSFLMGAIEKVGVIPGLIASALAITKVLSSSGFSWIEGLSILLLFFYALMFPLMEASIKFERYASILEEYLEWGRRG